MRRLVLALLAAIAAGSAAAAQPDGCAALLPNGVYLVYVAAPQQHTEVCHAPAYWLSFDNAAHEPRVVAWTVTAEHLKGPHTPRTDDFRADPAVPESARPADYAGSGYDQGHMSDAEDNSWSPATEHLSFLMSNMIPQCGPCNRATWRYIENWTRALTKTRPVLYVLSGPVFPPSPATIGKDLVWVPSASWKLVIDLPGRAAWGFIVPNQANALKPGSAIAPYLVSPAAVEKASGLTLPIPAGIDRSKSAPLPE